MTDPIADMLTRIRNALSRRADVVSFPHSKLKQGILEVLKKRSLVENYELDDTKIKKNLIVKLKYTDGKPAISMLKRVSKPGLRVYSDYKMLPVVKNHFGFVIVSTSKGIKDTLDAKREKIGGEIICEIS